MDKAILSTEIFGIVALLVILYGAWFETKERSSRKKSYLILVATVIAGLLVDALSYLPLDWHTRPTLFFVITLFAHIAPFFVFMVFLQYIFLHISGKVKVSRIPILIGEGYCGVGVFFSIYYGIKGQLFVIENGIHSAGEYYNGYLLTYVVLLLYACGVVLLCCKKIGLHDTVAALMFMLIPLLFVILNINYHSLAFWMAALALSMIVINTMLQAERENSLIASEVATSMLAHSDELTGLQNRLAYTEICDRMHGDGTVGVIFADVNGLKYTNDHFGHKAGDDLLCDFARILQECFRKDEIYRISGDEFVVIMNGISQGVLDKKKNMLKGKVVSKKIPIASLGYAFGSQSSIAKLLDLAEEEMYADKKEFHAKYPEYGRNTQAVARDNN